MKYRTVLALTLALSMAPASAGAQAVDAAAEPNASERFAELRLVRLEGHRERRREGMGLMAWGALGLAGGVALSIAGRDDSALLAFGLTTISFAAINVPLGLGLMDLGGGARRDIDLSPPLDAEDGGRAQWEEALTRAIRRERGKRISFIVNGGLDVLYILTGALMIGLADRTKYRDSMIGAGWSMVSQGAGLLVYDAWGIYGTTRRMRRLSALSW